MKIWSVSFLATAVAVALSSNAIACTGLIVGKEASNDGSIMIARNEDFSINNSSVMGGFSLVGLYTLMPGNIPKTNDLPIPYLISPDGLNFLVIKQA